MIMAALLRLLAASVLATSAIVSATPSTTTSSPFNPASLLDHAGSLSSRSYLPVAANAPGNLPLPGPDTNALRMKRGLGPKKPNFKHHRRSLHPRQSSTPCTSPTGLIRVAYVDDDGATINGYLAAVPNDFGEYTFSGNQSDALRVQLNNCGSDDKPFDIFTLNGIENQRFLGLVDGFSNESPDLGPGSYNYVYLGGTSQTPSGSTPLVQSNSFTDATNLPEAVESAVWALGSNGVLTASWINPDKSAPDEVLLYVPSAGTFTITGDRRAFRETFGPAFPTSFTFVAV